MTDRADMLRKRIAAYRSALREGGGMEYVRMILTEISCDQAQLEQIEKDIEAVRPSPPKPPTGS